MATILLVEDDPLIREIAAEALRDEEYHVREAVDGADALEQLQLNADIDLIVLDMRMPVMDGEAFVEHARRLGYDIPILLMSATTDIRATARLIAADAFIAKPFDLDEFLSEVSRLARVEDVRRA